MAAVKCPACERIIRFHAKGRTKLDVTCSSKRCDTTFSAELRGDRWPDEPKRKRKS